MGIGGDEGEVVDPTLRRFRDGPHLGGVDGRLNMDFGDAGGEMFDRLVDPLAAAGAPVVVEMIREHHALVRGEVAEREAGLVLGDRRRQPDRQSELDSQLQVHVEELGAECDRREVRCEVGDVDVPCQGTLDLGAALAQHFFRIGVLPEVVDLTRKPGLAAVQ